MQNNRIVPAKEELLARRAEELFSAGYNCCESMIKASIEIYQLPLPEDTYLLGKFFRMGVAESGCICGALAGGVMMLGYLAGAGEYKKDLAQKFREDFVAEFGSTCCRVIRKQQSLTGRFRNKKCREITAYAAGLLQAGQHLQEGQK